MRWATPAATATVPASGLARDVEVRGPGARVGTGGGVAGAGAGGEVTARWADGTGVRSSAAGVVVEDAAGPSSDGDDHRSGTTRGSAVASGALPEGTAPEKSGTDRCATSGTNGPAAGAGSAAIGVPAAVARWIGTGGAATPGCGFGSGAGPVSPVRTTSGSSARSGRDGASAGGTGSGASGGRGPPLLAAGVRWAVGGSAVNGSPSPKPCGRTVSVARWSGGSADDEGAAGRGGAAAGSASVGVPGPGPSTGTRSN
ncbi:hypothetical protein AB0L85_20935 [Streptomyces sp. NPDC052051]|uniref:hypothetical protein n=1 Tax=Streptomyces sp. NPDC052051 TaxID=3154649 RepID=UPI00341C23FB